MDKNKEDMFDPKRGEPKALIINGFWKLSDNFDFLIEYYDVMNNQRSVVYDRRTQALSGENIRDEVKNILNDYHNYIQLAYFFFINQEYKRLI